MATESPALLLSCFGKTEPLCSFRSSGGIIQYVFYLVSDQFIIDSFGFAPLCSSIEDTIWLKRLFLCFLFPLSKIFYLKY